MSLRPAWTPHFSLALVKILNVNADPYGPDTIQVISTNGYADPPTNSNPSSRPIIPS
jgi:hypothetical protein